MSFVHQTAGLLRLCSQNGIPSICIYYAFDKSIYSNSLSSFIKIQWQTFHDRYHRCNRYGDGIFENENTIAKPFDHDEFLLLIGYMLANVNRVCIHEFNGRIENLSYAQRNSYQKQQQQSKSHRIEIKKISGTVMSPFAHIFNVHTGYEFRVGQNKSPSL